MIYAEVTGGPAGADRMAETVAQVREAVRQYLQSSTAVADQAEEVTQERGAMPAQVVPVVRPAAVGTSS